jgi:hypothetical protein
MRKFIACIIVSAGLLGAIAYAVRLRHDRGAADAWPGSQALGTGLAPADESDGPGVIGPAPLPDKESEPPSGLPIFGWGVRNHFPIILKPNYVSAERGNGLLARDEPVLGLVIGSDVRAYPTNQLNKHEMLLDTVGGTPVLVTY